MAERVRREDLAGTSAWPFVGREDELAWIERVRTTDTSYGVVVSGAAGVGKSRLAREALDSASKTGAPCEWVQATRAAASIPLGAFAGLVPAGTRTDDRLQLFQVCADVLRERAGPDRVVLGVDDAHLLDPVSAALVLHLSTSRTAFVVVTVRVGERCEDSIVALWKDLEVPRLELQELSPDETAELLEEALGGELVPGTRQWAFDASQGHVLYLRELVKGALVSGALVRDGGLWRLRAVPRVSGVLADLISLGLEGLTDAELEAARLLALGEPLELEALAELVELTAVAGLEEKGLAVVSAASTTDRAMEVRLSHPLYGDVVQDSLPRTRRTQLLLRLAENVQARGRPRMGDALRVAKWLDEAGVSVEAPLLLAAAREANAAADPDLAERLARDAGDRGAEPTDVALAVARAHVLRRRFDDAQAVLEPLQGRLATPEAAFDYLEELAVTVLDTGLERREEALELLSRARDWYADRRWRDRVDVLRSQVIMMTPGTGPMEAAEILGALLEQDDVLPELRRRATIDHALALHEAGRTADARAVSESLQPSIPLRGMDDALAVLAWARPRESAGAEWEETERWLVEAAADPRNDRLTQGELALLLAGCALRRGQPATMVRRGREAVEIFERFDTHGRLPFAWLFVALGSAARRDVDGGQAALVRYLEVVGSAPGISGLEAIARAGLAAAEGETSRAVAVMLAAIPASQDPPISRARLLHEALRVGVPVERVMPGLEAAARACDAPIVSALVRLAAARGAADGDALFAAAEELAEAGYVLWAAEAAAWAAVAYRDVGFEDSTRRAIALRDRLLDRCEDVWSPVLADVGLARVELTQREREIVSLAANGASNAEIAERLVLSVRTVESHLYRAMRKLGVSSRQELAGG